MEYTRLKDINIDLYLNQRVFIICMINNVDIRVQKDNITRYIKMDLIDNANKITVSKFGANDNDILLLTNGAVIAVSVDIKMYNGQKTGVIYKYELYNEETSEFIDWSQGRDWAVQVINESINKLNGSVYYQLVYDIILEYWEQFKVWIAGKAYHHNKLGGLLVHTAEVVETAIVIGNIWNKRYGDNFVNMNLLIASCILHDIGKLNEIKVDTTTGQTEYSEYSVLETHITNGLDIIIRKVIKLGIGEEQEGKSKEQQLIEKEAINTLKHCILAHHGKKEWGSPIEPNCPEAFILHKADEISASMYRYKTDFDKIGAGMSTSSWINNGYISTYKDLTKT